MSASFWRNMLFVICRDNNSSVVRGALIIFPAAASFLRFPLPADFAGTARPSRLFLPKSCLPPDLLEPVERELKFREGEAAFQLDAFQFAGRRERPGAVAGEFVGGRADFRFKGDYVSREVDGCMHV